MLFKLPLTIGGIFNLNFQEKFVISFLEIRLNDFFTELFLLLEMEYRIRFKLFLCSLQLYSLLNLFNCLFKLKEILFLKNNYIIDWVHSTRYFNFWLTINWRSNNLNLKILITYFEDCVWILIFLWSKLFIESDASTL